MTMVQYIFITKEMFRIVNIALKALKISVA